jgi:hypothetical protein
LTTVTLIPVSFPNPSYIASIVNNPRHWHHVRQTDPLRQAEIDWSYELLADERFRVCYRQLGLQDYELFCKEVDARRADATIIDVEWDPFTGAYSQDIIEGETKTGTELVLVRGRRERRRFHLLARIKKGLVDIRKAAALLALAQPITHRVQTIEELKLVRKDGRRFLTYEENNRLKAGVLPDLRNIKLSARQRRLVKDIKQRKTRRVVRPGRELQSA